MPAESNEEALEARVQLKKEMEYKSRIVRNHTPLITEFLDRYKDILKDKKLCEEGAKGKLVEIPMQPFLLQLLLDYEDFKIEKKKLLF
jgi:hypothetical protein